jgi:hypothetical protein
MVSCVSKIFGIVRCVDGVLRGTYMENCGMYVSFDCNITCRQSLTGQDGLGTVRFDQPPRIPSRIHMLIRNQLVVLFGYMRQVLQTRYHAGNPRAGLDLLWNGLILQQ